MKNRFILSIISFGFAFSSCSDLLDVVPENVVTQTHFYKTEQDFEALTSGAQIFLRSNLSQVGVQDFAGALADGASGFFDIGYWTHMWNSNIGSWGGYYSAIYQSNLIIENLHKVAMPEDRVKYYMGQAHFVKGMMYFELAKRWGDAIIAGRTNDEKARGKSPAKDVLDTALNNAIKAYEFLEKQGENIMYGGKVIESKQYGNKANSATLVANIYAWKAAREKGVTPDKRNYYLGKAIEYATLVIDNKCGTFALESDPETMITGTLSSRGGVESIFETEMNVNDGLQSYAFNLGGQYISWPVVTVHIIDDVTRRNLSISSKTVEKMYKPGDRRRDAYFYEFETYKNDRDQLTCKTQHQLRDGSYEPFVSAIFYKYRKVVLEPNLDPTIPPNFVNIDCNNVIWRLADVILLRAECACKLGDVSLAISDLNTIRERAYGDKSGNYPQSGDPELQLAIFREREKELLGEGQRYFDIMRNGNDYVRRELPYEFQFLTDLKIEQGALYLPVDPAAFNKNAAMIQNEYWLNNTK